MSELKRSSFEIEQERKARQAALARLDALTANHRTLRDSIQTALAGIPAGVKQSFLREMTRIEAWGAQQLPTASADLTNEQLQALAGELQAGYEAGKECLRLVVDIKEVRREAKARELLGALELARSEVEGLKGRLEYWRPGSFADLTHRLDGLPRMVEDGSFNKVEARLHSVGGDLERLRQDVTALQEQDERGASGSWGRIKFWRIPISRIN